MNFKAFPALFLLNLALSAHAQFYNTGADPASIHWMQIRTPKVHVVFPQELQGAAIRFLDDLNATAGGTVQPFSRSVKPIPILIHNTSVLSNGYVTWAPRRMEIIATPPQDNYAQPWLTQLGLHEYRHVAQISQLHQGFTRGLTWFTGEAGMGIAAAMIPSWLYEGDAVWNETALSASGRGRSARFSMPLRTLLLDRPGLYPYNKALLGSYRDYVPDHYQYGFQMTAYARTRYGDSFWPEGFTYAARNPFLVVPMSLYLKSHTGKAKAGLYRETLDSLKLLYKRQEETNTSIIYSPLNRKPKRSFTSYTLPEDAGNGRVLALRSGIGERTAFVLIDAAGEERRVVYTGLYTQLRCDVYGDRLVWEEITNDPRWEGRDYSELRTASLKTGRTHQLTTRSRYFSPSFSPDGSQIAVAENDLADNHFLTLLNASTGAVLQRISLPDNREIQMPVWMDANRIAAVTVAVDGKRIEVVEMATEQWRELLPVTTQDISDPAPAGRYLLFRSARQSVENVHALDTKTGRVWLVTQSRYGAAQPSLSRDSARILFSEYSGKGNNVTSVPFDTTSWIAVSAQESPRSIWTALEPPVAAARPDPRPDLRAPEVTPYRKAAHLFRFHSWLPFYTNLISLDGITTDWPIHAGAMMFSQNLLSTVISSVGYEYAGGYHYIKPRISWRGWYPVLEATASVGGPVHAYPLPEGMTVPGKSIPYHEYTLRAYVPLLYNRGVWVSTLLPRVEYQHTATWYNQNGSPARGIGYVHLRMLASRLRRPVVRDLYPSLGAYVSAVYTETPGDHGLLGSMFSANAVIYLPGLLKHHHLVLQGGYQKQQPDFYLMGLNRVSFPRGYSDAISLEFSRISVDYAFPLAYPDLSAGWLLYLKRLRADLFYDGAYGTDVRGGKDLHYTGSYGSAGVELRADFHLFRIIVPVSAGVRLGYRTAEGTSFAEFLLGIDAGIF